VVLHDGEWRAWGGLRVVVIGGGGVAVGGKGGGSGGQGVRDG